MPVVSPRAAAISKFLLCSVNDNTVELPERADRLLDTDRVADLDCACKRFLC